MRRSVAWMMVVVMVMCAAFGAAPVHARKKHHSVKSAPHVTKHKPSYVRIPRAPANVSINGTVYPLPPPAVTPPPVPNAPPPITTFQDRAARCTHFGTLYGVPGSDMGPYIHNCASP